MTANEYTGFNVEKTKSNFDELIPTVELCTTEPCCAVGQFEKVTFRRFQEDIRNDKLLSYLTDAELVQIYSDIQLPKRATAGSAGYDFRSPFGFSLMPKETIKIPTGIRVKIEDGWWLGCFPRSSLGFKYRLQLDNTIGVIDPDYYNSDNEGHIFVKLTNDSYENRIVSIDAGDKFMQGIFIPFGITYDDRTTTLRNGGMGSTGR